MQQTPSNMEVGGQWPVGQSAACFCKILLQQPSPFYCVLSTVCFITIIEFSSYNREHLAHKADNLYYLPLYGKSWPAPVLMYQRAGRDFFFLLFAYICSA